MGPTLLVADPHGKNDVVFSGGGSCRWPKAAVAQLRQGIAVLMRRWTGLQMALHHQWGGCDSRQKYDRFTADLLAWLSQSSKGAMCVEELENFLHESMLLSFNTEMEDGSIELVAEQLMIMHEDYLYACQCHGA